MCLGASHNLFTGRISERLLMDLIAPDIIQSRRSLSGEMDERDQGAAVLGSASIYARASSESSQGNRTQGDIPLPAVAVSSRNTFLLEFGFETSTQM